MPHADRTPLGLAQSQPLRILFKTKKDWPIPPTPATTVKTEVPPQTAVIPHAMVMPKQVAEKCTWGLHCPICIKEEEEGQGRLEWGQAERSVHNHHSQSSQHPQLFDVPNRY